MPYTESNHGTRGTKGVDVASGGGLAGLTPAAGCPPHGGPYTRPRPELRDARSGEPIARQDPGRNATFTARCSALSRATWSAVR